jgi:hypothetical protein
MLDDSEDKLFYPEKLPSKGERVAWILTVTAGITWIILFALKITVLWIIPVIFMTFFLSSILIHMGNWIDRKTVISLNKNGLIFQDGLRNIEIEWGAVEKVEIFPSQWGKKVTVNGGGRRFNFRTLGVVELSGEIKGKIGFIEGEMILNTILERSQLSSVHKLANSYYYTR